MGITRVYLPDGQASLGERLDDLRQEVLRWPVVINLFTWNKLGDEGVLAIGPLDLSYGGYQVLPKSMDSEQASYYSCDMPPSEERLNHSHKGT